MEKTNEKSLKVGAKSSNAGFVVASVLLVLFSIYRIIKTGVIPPVFIILGASQAAF